MACFGGNSPWLWLVILASNFWWWTWLSVSVADRLVSSQVLHGLLLFLSSGPCRSIESQQDFDEHRLEIQWNWQGRSRGLVLGTGVCGPRPRNGEIKMESSGVPVVFETFETLVVLDRCRACASFQKSHWNGMETRWKWDGGGCSDTCEAREQIQYKYLAISCFGMFWRKFTLTLTRHLGFKFLVVEMAFR